MKSYNATLRDGREIFIPSWPASVQFENLTTACKHLGQDEVINISYLNVAAAMLAVMKADQPRDTTAMVLHFVQQARIDGKKITAGSLDDLGINTIIELFTHVIHSQYNDFFESGLAKVHSPDK